MVFGAWATWTYKSEEYAADAENKNYCAYEPMMYAIVILITKWVSLFFSTKIFLKPLLFPGPAALPGGALLPLQLPVCLLPQCLSCLSFTF